MLQRLRDFFREPLRVIFGDDIFISYSRADGITYAEGLASELAARGFSCRVDLLESQPGDELPESLKRTLRDSRMLVVIASDGASRSPHVALEIEEFSRTQRMVIPIDVGGALDRARWLPLVRGLPIAEETDAAALVVGKPSPGIVSRIENSARFTRRNRRLRLLSWLSVEIFSALAILSVIAVRRSVRALQDAAAARGDAAAATSQAHNARRTANEQTAIAKNAERDALGAAPREALARKEAARQQQLADFARVSARLEIDGAGVVRQFDAGNGELDALRSAISVGEKLQVLVQRDQGVAQYPAVTPLLALNRVVFEIRERYRLDTHQSKLRSIALSPSGQIAVLEGDGNVTGDTSVWLWTADGKLLASWSLAQGGTGAAKFTADGRRLVVQVSRGIQSWTLNGTLDRDWPGASTFFEARNGKLRMIAGGSTVSVFDDDWRHVVSVSGGTEFRIHPTRDLILTAGTRAITQFDFTGRAERFFEPQFGSLREMHFGVDGETLIAAYSDGVTYAIDVKKRDVIYRWDTLRDRTGPRLSPAEPLLATVGGDGAVSRVGLQRSAARALFWPTRWRLGRGVLS